MSRTEQTNEHMGNPCLKHVDNHRPDVDVTHSHAGRHHMADSQHGVSRQALKWRQQTNIHQQTIKLFRNTSGCFKQLFIVELSGANYILRC